MPLAMVGRYTMWPMLVGMLGKFLTTGYESFLLQRSVPRLAIRRISNSIASCMACACTVGFVLAPSPLLSCVAYCGVSVGARYIIYYYTHCSA